jgi:hypothetical protein
MGAASPGIRGHVRDGWRGWRSVDLLITIVIAYLAWRAVYMITEKPPLWFKAIAVIIASIIAAIPGVIRKHRRERGI